jgi:RNA polymerase sigma-70 factor (ECF subfamily)
LAQEDPEGLLDEAYVQARDHWADFEPPPGNPEAACYAWLKQIVLNVFRDVLDYYLAAKRDARKQQSLPDDSSVLAKLDVFDRGTGPRTKAELQEMEERLQVLLERLDPADREVLTLRELEGRSYAEVADLLGIRKGAARIRHMRALLRIRVLWQTEYPLDWSKS